MINIEGINLDKDSKIYISGHRGLVGKHLVETLKANGYTNLIVKDKKNLNLLDQSSVLDFFSTETPEYVFHIAGKVGGIMANVKFPADFLYQNLQMQNNVIHASHLSGVSKLLFTGSSCIYPREVEQPMIVENLFTGKFEPTNEAYAIAKIAGIKMTEYYNQQYGANFISCIPSNLYGPGDNFDPQNSHVLSALVRKFVHAKRDGDLSVQLWGTGSARREFLHVRDCVEGMIYLMKNYNDPTPINLGSGSDIQILELARTIKEIIGYQGEIVLDPSKPDGMPQKLMDVTEMTNLGWQAKTSLKDGIRETVDYYIANYLETVTAESKD